MIPKPTMTPAQGRVLYDSECSLCTRLAWRCHELLRRNGFQLAPLPAGGRAREMMVLLPDGRALGGADGIMQIARRVWWAWPLFVLAQVPGMMILFRATYRVIAARRTCLGNACQLAVQRRTGDWLVLALLPTLVLLTRNFYAAWVFMWLLAFAVFFGCKWLTWRRGLRQMGEVNWFISFGYLFGWVGMDEKKFLNVRHAHFKPKTGDWLLAGTKTLTGVALIWLVARQLVAPSPILAGWTGMLGVILCLHFGLFQLLALAWQRIGVNAPPIMRKPVKAVSLADFWGRRWNGAFHQLAHELAFRPLLRKCGPIWATLTVFLISGLIHDLLISIPARGGYGLPTAYFLIQGLGVIFERTTWAKKIGLSCGRRGRLFAIICAAGPAYWLFHPVFIHHIILPMLHAIGAT